MSQCKSCGAKIIWIKTAKNGKNMPLNAKPVDLDRIHDDASLFNEGGEFAKPGWADRDDNWHVPHWSTCPDADKFRKENS